MARLRTQAQLIAWHKKALSEIQEERIKASTKYWKALADHGDNPEKAFLIELERDECAKWEEMARGLEDTIVWLEASLAVKDLAELEVWNDESFREFGRVQ